MSQNKQKSVSAETEPTIAAGGGSAWPFVLLGVVLFGCFLHVENTGGAFRADVFQAGMKNPPPQANEPEEVKLYKRGALLYSACVGCHQPSGLGSTALNFPPLAGSDWVVREKPDRLIRIILNGVEGPIKVKDVTYDSPQMLAFRDTFKEDFDVAAIATFIRGNAAWGNGAGFVTPEQVKAIRDATEKMGSQKWRSETLQAID